MKCAVLALASVGLIACATHDAQPTPPAYGPTQAPLRLAQHGYGDDAHFAYCPTPDCPQPTPKWRPGVGSSAPAGHLPDTRPVASQHLPRPSGDPP
ncbi:hypothetical protein LDO26_00745 [Luteimonas sp. BDR2-5]|uniref:hypothetical protein n=1 Tax=Proluteimonas luteida TaxID=2878685 RepID=UPI001E5C230C|nr:hypothetical protein [Luteimonas sp. BDR2-5]MCD9026742.1 hypothetical protein [Luteimonas sp. BDR2-5]